MERDDCCIFAGSVSSYGYGILFNEGKQLKAHRVMYETVVGKIPNGKYLDHLCRVRQCINPDHLEPVSNTENIMRGQAPSAQNARKTHCSKGHEFTNLNTQYRKNGWRICRACHTSWTRSYRAKLREKYSA